MKLAPLGAFGAMAYAIGKYGVSTLTSLGSLIGLFYLTSALFVFVVLGSVMAYLRLNIWHMLKYLREELLLILGTSTAEPALPGLMRKLEYAGVPKPTVGLVVPTGYSFNLDGAAIYLSLAALYIAQATNTNLTIGQQLGLLAVMLLTSKGAAGVAGGGFIALTATLSTIGHIPVVGIMLIFGIDKFMSECRALVNFIGNAVATLFVAKWNGELDVVRARAVFAGKDVEPLVDPSEDLDVNPYDPPRTSWSGPTTASWPWPVPRRRRPPQAQKSSGRPAERLHSDGTAIGRPHRRRKSPPKRHRHQPFADPTKDGRPMRVLIAPDKFKGSLTAAEVADHLAKGLTEAGAHIRALPLADGGDGSVAAALASGFHPLPVDVHGATGESHRAIVAFNGDTAIVEVANTCGLATLPGGALPPMTASSYGFGEAIRAALTLSRHRLVLGARRQRQHRRRHRDARRPGIPLPRPGRRSARPDRGEPGPHPLRGQQPRRRPRRDRAYRRRRRHEPADRADRSRSRLRTPKRRHRSTSRSARRRACKPRRARSPAPASRTPTRFAHAPGSGAAGGIGFAAMLLGASTASGAEYFLDLLDFDRHVADADLVITGEGRLDDQTLQGKLPAAVALRAAPTPVVAVVGRNDLEPRRQHRVHRVFAVADLSDTDTSRDPQRTAELLQHIGTQIGSRFVTLA